VAVVFNELRSHGACPVVRHVNRYYFVYYDNEQICQIPHFNNKGAVGLDKLLPFDFVESRNKTLANMVRWDKFLGCVEEYNKELYKEDNMSDH
jgi:hypothetical protein